MDIATIIQTPWFNWIVMPVIIILARILDVSLSTVRVYLTARGEKKFAAGVGFVEVLIWLIIVRQIIIAIDNPAWYIAYATGFALGTYIGISISERLSVGRVIVRIIVKEDATRLISALKKEGFGYTVVDSHSEDHRSFIIFSVMHSNDVALVSKLIKQTSPKAFFTVEDVRRVSQGNFRKEDKNNFFVPVDTIFKTRLGK